MKRLFTLLPFLFMLVLFVLPAQAQEETVPGTAAVMEGDALWEFPGAQLNGSVLSRIIQTNSFLQDHPGRILEGDGKIIALIEPGGELVIPASSDVTAVLIPALYDLKQQVRPASTTETSDAAVLGSVGNAIGITLSVGMLVAAPFYRRWRPSKSPSFGFLTDTC